MWFHSWMSLIKRGGKKEKKKKNEEEEKNKKNELKAGEHLMNETTHMSTNSFEIII